MCERNDCVMRFPITLRHAADSGVNGQAQSTVYLFLASRTLSHIGFFDLRAGQLPHRPSKTSYGCGGVIPPLIPSISVPTTYLHLEICYPLLSRLSWRANDFVSRLRKSGRSLSRLIRKIYFCYYLCRNRGIVRNLP